MNFLAHLFLSDENPEIMVGNFIADMVKGNSFLGYPSTIGKGIRIHRNIDKFTDSHPIVQLSKKRLRPNYRKYAGVIVDMFYDHLLAVDWHTYSPIPLASFAEKAYKTLDSYQSLMPIRSQRTLFYMQKGNWLVNYAELSGIGQALGGLSNRTRYESGIEQSINDLRSDYSAYRNEFSSFFPDLIEFNRVELNKILDEAG